jgi:hypothetical protein
MIKHFGLEADIFEVKSVSVLLSFYVSELRSSCEDLSDRDNQARLNGQEVLTSTTVNTILSRFRGVTIDGVWIGYYIY